MIPADSPVILCNQKQKDARAFGHAMSQINRTQQSGNAFCLGAGNEFMGADLSYFVSNVDNVDIPHTSTHEDINLTCRPTFNFPSHRVYIQHAMPSWLALSRLGIEKRRPANRRSGRLDSTMAVAT